jgi:hypothetical protein
VYESLKSDGHKINAYYSISEIDNEGNFSVSIKKNGNFAGSFALYYVRS